MKYHITEVQKCARFRIWEWEVEAESPEEALNKVRNGKGKLANDDKPYCDEDYCGNPGYAVHGQSDDPIGEAIDNIMD